MTKLAELLNDYYATENKTAADHIKEIIDEVPVEDIGSELVSLFRHLDAHIQ